MKEYKLKKKGIKKFKLNNNLNVNIYDIILFIFIIIMFYMM